MRKIIYLIISLTVLMIGLYFYFIGNTTKDKELPKDKMENPPAAETVLPSKGKEEEAAPIKKESVNSPISPEKNKMERPSSLPLDSHGDSVKLEDQSYSIKNEKKEISITPGVVFQPGKSVNVKIPGGDEIIRVERDKNYHPGGYNVLWEKKY